MRPNQRRYVLKQGDFRDAELREVAALHVAEISSGFLASLGPAPLCLIYGAAAVSPTSVLITASDPTETSIGGFICGTVDCAALYREFIKRHGARALIAFAPQLLSPVRWRRALETWCYAFRRDLATLPKAEVLNFVVRPDHRGGGLATALFARLEDELARRGARQVRMVTGVTQIAAQRFYERVGARCVREVRLHSDQRSLVYVYDFPLAQVQASD